MSLELPGFADPVLGAQSTFRAVLEAISRPGTVVKIGAGLTPPAPLNAASAAVLLTLIDADTALYLPPEAEAAREWLVFHATPRMVESMPEAEFALAFAMPDLGFLNVGTDDGPEQGATLILQIEGIEYGELFELSGPGLAAPRRIALRGLPDDFAARWMANHRRFPRGIDLILCAGDELVAFPRSLSIKEA
jgi:alpha-D-ribose 1-methylphosphonate 5-triphosphate synthase subunit PhnH